MDIEFTRRALAAKALARKNRSLRNRVGLIGALAGLGIAILWIITAPTGSLDPGTRFALCTGGGYALARLFLERHAKQWIPEKAQCPTCGYDWEILEGDGVPVDKCMENWDKCPGCGTLMNDLVLTLAQNRHARQRDGQHGGGESS